MYCVDLIRDFISKIADNQIELYNEASVQYELAMFLREKLPDYKIQLERNIDYFGLEKRNFIKKEIDIVIFDEQKTQKTAIEIKFPTNGQYPEQMFSFCKDVKFLEQLHDEGFQNNIFLALAINQNFWNDKGNPNTIYEMFRKRKIMEGTIGKPTGSKDEFITLNGSHKINWNIITSDLRYFVISI